MKGQRVGHYEILGKLGEGGMGAVYLARHGELNRRIALKTISERWLSTGVILKRFIQEAEVLAKIDHPNVVTTYAFFQERGRWFLAMEYVEGPALSSLVRPGSPVPVREAVELAYKVARGLACAHEYGVIHRDVKPSNVLMKSRSTPKISDFGLVRYIKNEEIYPRTKTTLLGSPKHMSPEHWSGEKFTVRSDIYSLGIVLYQLLTGLVPFEATTLDGLKTEAMNTRFVTPSKRRAAIGRELDEVVERMTQRDPADRYASMQDVMTALSPFRAKSASKADRS